MIDEDSLKNRLLDGEELTAGVPACSEIALLARLELCVDSLESPESEQDEIQRQVENIKALLHPRTVRRFEQLRRRDRRAVVSIERSVCQGCYLQIPAQLDQKLRADAPSLHSCPHCNRFIYAAYPNPTLPQSENGNR